MLSRKCWIQVGAINGGGGFLFLKSLVNFSTAAAAAPKPPSENADFVDYLINSLGFSKDAAIASSVKVSRSSHFQKKADSVVNYFENLGLNKTVIRSMVSVNPRLLFCKVDKILEPKVEFFRELGLSGSDIIKFIMGCKSFWRIGLDSRIKPRILLLRQWVGTDDNVLKVLRKYSRVLANLDVEMVMNNLKLLRSYGFTDQNIAKWITYQPRIFFVATPEEIEEIMHRVENELGILRGSNMLPYGFDVISANRRSNIEEKFRLLRSFGWSESQILGMVRTHPYILSKSGPRIQKTVDYFTKELGYDLDYLASRPVFFSLSLEKRLKPRNEVLRILNEKNLNKRKTVLFTVSVMSESKFLKNYMLPFKDTLPDVYEAYMNKVEIPKFKSI